ncbi:hypothetical protein BN2497_2383 [Janthinobacterium sp. CG23_2]|nr:hypothetical protein BN2497_2383 [Janthinobacterium sp. CG23_2]CUU27589.1 hypothetical protein BN3177_2383 [Janthinobacterium sp. CG23_2]
MIETSAHALCPFAEVVMIAGVAPARINDTAKGRFAARAGPAPSRAVF